MRFDPDIERVHRELNEFLASKRVVIVTAKAKDMTQTEIDNANKPRIIDYLGLMR